MPAQQFTIAEALAQGRALCAQSGTDSAALDAQLLLMHVLDCDRTYLYTWPDRALTETQGAQYQHLIEQRGQGVPVAHLIGMREFWSLPLRVNNSTLIPRPDTEVLVEQALQHIHGEHADVLELGTGTGAIALALASERPQWSITAVDRAQDAVRLAEDNCKRLGFANVQIMTSDWFSAIEASARFHLIISNPPYIAHDDHHLNEGDVRFEPHSALVAEQGGYADLAYIIETAWAFLRPGGWLMLEHGVSQSVKVREFFRELGYAHIYTAQDYANLDRVTCGQRPSNVPKP
ncbi:peptide chain release factor N(5)-glutamine methyltransferase [Aliidiomarina indica]|uniref:peptide chain release factor N(5)-glutamine methyltransferase n=1 Tax=Aliidiomarina indica TaxID=2749147 RepID=UPI00188E7C72|nr:peptide chain release factor N(5)-glutamine methyltransferase [Aliidiomarina indica]